MRLSAGFTAVPRIIQDNVQKEGGRFLQKKEGIKLPVMSKLNVDQKTIKDLFQSKKSDFLIPDYQRPYAWSEAECRTLWDDIFSFAIPDE